MDLATTTPLLPGVIFMKNVYLKAVIVFLQCWVLTMYEWTVSIRTVVQCVN